MFGGEVGFLGGGLETDLLGGDEVEVVGEAGVVAVFGGLGGESGGGEGLALELEFSGVAVDFEQGVIDFFDGVEEGGFEVGGDFLEFGFGLENEEFAVFVLENRDADLGADVEEFAVFLKKVFFVEAGVASVAEEGDFGEKVDFAYADLGGGGTELPVNGK